MSNWSTPRPKEGWSDKERADFFQEIWDRFKWFRLTMPNTFTAPANDILLISVTTPGGGGDIETVEVRGWRTGMSVKLTYVKDGVVPPAAGLTWDAAVVGDESLFLWFNNSSAVPIAIHEGDWTVMGVIT